MRILKLKNGEEIETSEEMFLKIEPYLKFGKNRKFTLGGKEYRVYEIDHFSEPIDDVFMTVIDRQTSYIEQATKPEEPKNTNEKTWKDRQLQKLERYSIIPGSIDFPTITLNNTSQLGLGDGKLYFADKYKPVLELWKSITIEKRKELVEKAITLLDNFKMENRGAGRAYMLACKLKFINKNDKRNNHLRA